MIRVTSSLARRWMLKRKEDAHKGDCGHVLIVAGSRGMTGAAVLAARAALRAGAGLVTVGVPASQHPIVASQLAEAQTLPLPETSAGTLSVEAAGKVQLAHRERGYSVMAMGPGLGTHSETARAVVGLLGSLALPVVVDADALNVLARNLRDSVRKLLSRRGMPCIFTPHPGEAARLLGIKASEVQADRAGCAERVAKEFGVTCLLKGRGTIVTDGACSFANTTGNSGLAKGGSGDALTGIVAALWSQRISQAWTPRSGADKGLEAAALGAYLHGLSADLAVKEKTCYGLLAGDVIENLPKALLTLL